MNLKPEFAALLNANKIPVEHVFRLQTTGWIVTKRDASGRCREMLRHTYENGIHKYERISGNRPGIVTLEIWGTGLSVTKSEVRIEEI